MRETQYKKFSLRTHKKNWLLKKPNTCQFELTFGCNLHCKHCYTDCYNKPAYLKKELKTKEVELILDKVYNAGVIWLCLTGGDPLTRGDFLDIYSYAKKKGFIITVFTNGCSMTEAIAGYFKKIPPFVIEITLNAVSGDMYEKISRVKGSFNKAMQGINLMLKEELPLKIKTEVTRDNFGEMPGIKKFIKGLGLKFRPNADLHARLNGDLAPCNLRISPQENMKNMNLVGRVRTGCLDENNGLNRANRSPPFARKPCGLPQEGSAVAPKEQWQDKMASLASTFAQIASADKSEGSAKMSCGFLRRQGYAGQVPRGASLFHCAIGSGDGFTIDPCGNTFPCKLIRKPAFNLLKGDVKDTLNKLLSLVRNREFTTDSNCNGCNLRELCQSCPGRAYLERGDMEAPVEDYCELARAISVKSR